MLSVRVGRVLSRRSPSMLSRWNSTLSQTIEREVEKDTPHIYNGEDQTALREKQAPNRDATWAPSQRPRNEAMTGTRFDGKDLTLQPQPYAAIDLIAQTPIIYVSGHAVCDGNAHGTRGGVQGHPKIYINVDKPEVHSCLYCGNKYADVKYKDQLGSV